MKLHRLKIWPTYFTHVVTGDKTFEVRKDDRNPPYSAGDLLLLEEFNPDLSATPPGLTGRWHAKKIGQVWRGAPMPDGYCAFSMFDADRVESEVVRVAHETEISR